MKKFFGFLLFFFKKTKKNQKIIFCRKNKILRKARYANVNKDLGFNREKKISQKSRCFEI
jgi:hypothetical protein